MTNIHSFGTWRYEPPYIQMREYDIDVTNDIKNDYYISTPMGEYIEKTMAWMDRLAVAHDWVTLHENNDLIDPDNGFYWYRYTPAKERFIPATGDANNLKGTSIVHLDFWQHLRDVTEFVQERGYPYGGVAGIELYPFTTDPSGLMLANERWPHINVRDSDLVVFGKMTGAEFNDYVGKPRLITERDSYNRAQLLTLTMTNVVKRREISANRGYIFSGTDEEIQSKLDGLSESGFALYESASYGLSSNENYKDIFGNVAMGVGAYGVVNGFTDTVSIIYTSNWKWSLLPLQCGETVRSMTGIGSGTFIVRMTNLTNDAGYNPPGPSEPFNKYGHAHKLVWGWIESPSGFPYRFNNYKLNGFDTSQPVNTSVWTGPNQYAIGLDVTNRIRTKLEEGDYTTIFDFDMSSGNAPNSFNYSTSGDYKGILDTPAPVGAGGSGVVMFFADFFDPIDVPGPFQIFYPSGDLGVTIVVEMSNGGAFVRGIPSNDPTWVCHPNEQAQIMTNGYAASSGLPGGLLTSANFVYHHPLWRKRDF